MNEQERREAQGERVLMARAAARLSREKLAESIAPLWEKRSRSYIERVEDGEVDPGFGFLLAVAEVTDKPIAWFTELEDVNGAKGVYDGWDQLALAV